MVIHVDTDTLLHELGRRRHQVAMERLAVARNRGAERPTGRIRRALGSVLLRLGAWALDDDKALRSNAGIGG